MRLLKQRAEQAPLLPSAVRIANSSKESMLGSREIASLFQNGLGNLGFYMIMKAADDHDGIQTELLSRASDYEYDLSRFRLHDAVPALRHLDTKQPPTVKGSKLHKIQSLFGGADIWGGFFRNKLEPAIAEAPEASLFMVASAPYVGFDQLAAVSLLNGRALGILKPSRFAQTEQPVGFLIEPSSSGADIRPLSHDFERPASAISFDDVSSTGTVENQVTSYWGPGSALRFVTAFVIQGSDSSSRLTVN